jgi:RsiW-degrading membrane proteinase PrsW (M82 family)
MANFIGFTVLVGFNEEPCNGVAFDHHLRHGRRHQSARRRVYEVGSGAGFGIAEGIINSTARYNGFENRPIYLIRFTSCVGRHAILSAAAGAIIRTPG